MPPRPTRCGSWTKPTPTLRTSRYVDPVDRARQLAGAAVDDQGLRARRAAAGVCVGRPARIAPLQLAQPPWNVNAFAQAAGLACLDELDWRRTTLARLRQDSAALMADLAAAGYAPRPSTLNFFLTPVTAPGELRRQLLEQRLVVRDCTSFGLPDYIRIAAEQPAPNALLVSAMATWANTMRPSPSTHLCANSNRR